MIYFGQYHQLLVKSYKLFFSTELLVLGLVLSLAGFTVTGLLTTGLTGLTGSTGLTVIGVGVTVSFL